jgi:hypothetical protein
MIIGHSNMNKSCSIMGSSPFDCKNKPNVKRNPLIKILNIYSKFLRSFVGALETFLEVLFHGLKRTKNLAIKSPNVVNFHMPRRPKLHGMPHGGSINPTQPLVFEKCK